MKHLLVTNDYPPKIGGIQSYLWELWRRLPPESSVVLTSPYKSDLKKQSHFDSHQPYKIYRSAQTVLLPTPKQAREIEAIARRENVEMIIYDPAIPIGRLGPKLDYPYGLIFHGAEISISSNLPFLRKILQKSLSQAELVITASKWAVAEAEKNQLQLPVCHYIPPGIDTERFKPLKEKQCQKIRTNYGVAEDTFLVVSVSRLVPRKGIDTLIKAVGQLAGNHDIKLIIAGSGRDQKRLERLIRKKNAPVEMLGGVTDEELPEVYGMADVFVMPCRTRWKGLEQEGFGIVFMEASSSGVPSIAGRSGGADEAVLANKTGLLLNDPINVDELCHTLEGLIQNPKKLKAMGQSGRKRAVQEFNYDLLASNLKEILKC